MSKESSFWTYLAGLLPKQGHYSRIESHMSSGFPDVHYTLNMLSGTIELKDTKKPGSKYPFSGPNGLRKSQRIWIRDNTLAGGKVVLALQCGDEVFLLDGESYYDTLHKMTLEDIEIAAQMKWQKGAVWQKELTRQLRWILSP